MNTVQEGDTATFFVQALGLAPAATTCPPGCVYKNFRANIRRSDSVGPTLSHSYRPKLTLLIETKQIKATTRISHVLRTEAQTV